MSQAFEERLDGVLENHAEGLVLACRRGSTERRKTVHMHEDIEAAIGELENEYRDLATGQIVRWLLVLGLAVLQEGRRASE